MRASNSWLTKSSLLAASFALLACVSQDGPAGVSASSGAVALPVATPDSPCEFSEPVAKDKNAKLSDPSPPVHSVEDLDSLFVEGKKARANCNGRPTPAPFAKATDILPPGEVIPVETIPQTLDLAERAKLFLQGMTQSLLLPGDWSPVQYQGINYSQGPAYAPPGPVLFHRAAEGTTVNFYDSYQNRGLVLPVCWRPAGAEPAGPCFEQSEGVPNWGKVVLALNLARRMTDYDRIDKDGTLGAHYGSARSMLSYETTLQLIYRALPGLLFVDANTSLAPTSVAMEAAISLYQHKRDPELREAINKMVDLHCAALGCIEGGSESIQKFFGRQNLEYAGGGPDGPLGMMGYDMWRIFIAAKAMQVQLDWYRELRKENRGNSVAAIRAWSLAKRLAQYLLSHQQSAFWRVPGGSIPSLNLSDKQGGAFAGQIHTQMQAGLALLMYAQLLDEIGAVERKPLRDAIVDLVARSYAFVKQRTEAELLGNFGEIGTVGDMIRVGILLTRLGKGMHYEEIERWARNQLVESQIDEGAAEYLENHVNPSLRRFHLIGSRAKGTFFSNATHSFAMPMNKNLRWNTDGPANGMRAMYEVWRNAVVVKGNFLAVNFLLNRAHQAVVIKSEVPYRGRIELRTKNLKMPTGSTISTIGVRIPDEVDVKSVRLSVGGAPSAVVTKFSGRYALIEGVLPQRNYVLTFGLVSQVMVAKVRRGPEQWWYEGIASTPQYESVTEHRVVLKGAEVVKVIDRPAPGAVATIPRYVRDRAEERAAPTQRGSRFAPDLSLEAVEP